MTTEQCMNVRTYAVRSPYVRARFQFFTYDCHTCINIEGVYKTQINTTTIHNIQHTTTYIREHEKKVHDNLYIRREVKYDKLQHTKVFGTAQNIGSRNLQS